MAKPVEKKDFGRYLKEARSWETDRVLELSRSRMLAWIVAIVASVAALAAVVTVALLTPIQRVEAYVVKVDTVSGKATVLKPSDAGDMTQEDAVGKYFVKSYVQWREGYVKSLADQYYYNVGLLSSPVEQEKFLKDYHTDNPQSPMNIFKNSGGRVIKVKEVKIVSSGAGVGMAEVKYSQEDEITDGKVNSVKMTQWSATIRYMYSQAPMTEKDREINPLGFQVITYIKTDETPPEQKPVGAVLAPNGDAAAAVQPAVSAIAPVVPAIKLDLPATPMGSQQAPTSAATPSGQ